MMAKDQSNEVLAATSFLYGGNAGFIEDLYAKYQENPDAVDQDWRDFFANLKDDKDDVISQARGASWMRVCRLAGCHERRTGQQRLTATGAPMSARLPRKLTARPKRAGRGFRRTSCDQATTDSIRALMMIRAYRVRGHLIADLDPLETA